MIRCPEIVNMSCNRNLSSL